MRRVLRGLPLPLMVVLLLVAGGWRVVQAGTDDAFGAALTTAGLVTLGFWLGQYNPAAVVVEPASEDEPLP